MIEALYWGEKRAQTDDMPSIVQKSLPNRARRGRMEGIASKEMSSWMAKLRGESRERLQSI